MEVSSCKLRVCSLYPDWMNLYGDRGNVIVIAQRCRWRGIEVELEAVGAGKAVDLRRHDILLIGGGSDSSQSLVSRDLVQEKAEVLREAVDDGLVVLAICGGYQLLGHYYRTLDGDDVPGIGILDAFTVAGTKRLVGNVAVCSTIRGVSLVGYENHSGRTYLGEHATPLGHVRTGYGNNGSDGTEGAVYRNCFGTYLHGPLLPKNPQFSDLLIELALTRRYGEAHLVPLDDALEMRAHRRVAKAGVKRRRTQ